MKAWIFDMDGTLTVAMHDFTALKRSLGLPLHLDVLAGVAARPREEHHGLFLAVRRWEAEHIDDACVADGVIPLLTALRGRPCGIVTRNTKENALRTLKAVGLDRFFAPEDVLGRHCAVPKPAPDALNVLLRRWNAHPAHTTMVGDHAHDLLAGRAAGCRTILVDVDGTGEFAQHADRTVRTLTELL